MNRLQQVGDELINFIGTLFEKYPDLTKAEVMTILETTKQVINVQYTVDYIKTHLHEIFDTRMLLH